MKFYQKLIIMKGISNKEKIGINYSKINCVKNISDKLQKLIRKKRFLKKNK